MLGLLLLQCMRKAMKNTNQGSWSPDRNLNCKYPNQKQKYCYM